MVDGRPHEFVSDACERDLEHSLGEDIREVALIFNVMRHLNSVGLFQPPGRPRVPFPR